MLRPIILVLLAMLVVAAPGCEKSTSPTASSGAGEHRTIDTVRDVQKRLRSDDIHERANAARSVYTLGPVAKDAVPDLVEALKSAIEKIPPKQRMESVPVMGDSYQHFVLALWAIGKPSESALLGLLDEKEPSVRLATVMGLHPMQDYIVRTQQQDEMAVNVLRKALHDKNFSVRYHACAELGDFRHVAKVAEPELQEVKEHDPEDPIRNMAVISLKSIER